MTATEHQMELLNDAHSTWLRAEHAVATGALTPANVRHTIDALNVMFDRAVDCGMSPNTPDVGFWVGERVARWLVEA